MSIDDQASGSRTFPSIHVLGGFRVLRGEEEFAVPPGRPRVLVALVATHRAPLAATTAALALWPEADPATGRRRLRNVLNRLGAGLVERAGDGLQLVPGVEVDAARFEAAARAALAADGRLDVTAARRALDLYRGELLPGEHGEWVTPLRERLRTRYLELLDRLAAAAEARGDLDDAVRLLGRAIDADRFDDRRHLRLAEQLAAQNRRGAALAALRRGEAMLSELGLEASAEFAALGTRLTGDAGGTPATEPPLSAGAYEAVLELVGEIHDARSAAELRQLLVVAIRRLVPAEWVSINEMLPGGRPGPYTIDPPLPAARRAAWQRLGHTNPLLQRYLRTHDGRPYRFSDVITRRELEALPLYREFYGPLGIHHQIAFTLPAPPEMTVAVALSRGDPDFSDRECRVLDRVRPHIIQAYRNLRQGDVTGP